MQRFQDKETTICKSIKFDGVSYVSPQNNIPHQVDNNLNDRWNKIAMTKMNNINIGEYYIKYIVHMNKMQQSNVCISKLVVDSINKMQQSNVCISKLVVDSKKHIQKKKNHQKSKLPLVLSAGIATTLIISSLITLPSPFSYIIAIAIAGPLSASLLGLRA